VPPGWNITVQVNTCTQGFTGRVQFIAVTERGRLFGSAPIDLLRGRIVAGLFPYTLTVSVINMKRGSDYTIDILPLGDADIHPRSITYKATASNENISLSFGATAGTFLVYLRENGILVSAGRLIAPPTNPMAVTLPDYWNVVFILSRSEILPVTIDLEISAPSRVLEGESFQFQIILSLPAEAGEDVGINHERIIQAISLGGDYEANTLTCWPVEEKLYPGSTRIALSCSLTAAELQGNRNTGSITITVNRLPDCGTGESSGLPYPSDQDSTIIDVRKQRGR
ncbi:MAG: hypothetical protein QXM16_07940, partial [Nitrososphaerota archaeon]